MKKNVLILWLLCCTFLANAQWKTTELLTPRSEMSGIYAGGMAFFAGGNEQIEPQNVPSKAVDIFDINTQMWTATQLSAVRYGFAAATVGKKVMFAGGNILNANGDFDYFDIVDVYNLETKTWSVIKMPEKRYNMQAVTIGDKVYFVGGRDLEYKSEIFIYDDTQGNWSTINLPGEPRSNVAVTAIGNKLFVAGGASSVASSTKVVDMYDVATQTWSSPGQLSKPRQLIKALSVDNMAYFVGGISGINGSSEIDIYDLTTNKWTSTTTMRIKYNSAVCTADKKIYIGGGGTLTPEVFGVEIFDTKTQKWVTPSINYPQFTRYFKQTGISTPKGIMIGGGETNSVGFLEKKVFMLDITSAVTEQKPEHLEIYPTPARDEVTFKLPFTEVLSSLQASVFDFTGKAHQVDLRAGQDALTYLISINELPKGYYILQVRTQSQLYISKIIKQ